MNQHLLVKIPERRTRSTGPVQLGTPHRCVACRDAAMRRSDEGREQDAISFANLGGAQSMSGAIALAEANALGLTCDWRLDLDRSGGPAVRRSGAPAFPLRSRMTQN
jgi:hypothetical protein